MISSTASQRFRQSIGMAIVVSIAILTGGCLVHAPTTASNRLNFVIVNTGQGLAQIAATNGHAVVWDMGSDSEFTEWQSQYNALNRPRIEAIIISHSHADHYAGLRSLPIDAPFSGTIIMSPHEDTALIRHNAGAWQDLISFKLLRQSDTLAVIPGTTITCLWPPDSVQYPQSLPIADSLKNRYSMVWKIEYQSTSFLITSDIDTIATQILSSTYGFALHTTCTMVPHHGSQSAYDGVFWGYCAPQFAVISCARYNSYGHPSAKIIDLLFGMTIDEMRTYSAGSILFESNGEYLAK